MTKPVIWRFKGLPGKVTVGRAILPVSAVNARLKNCTKNHPHEGPLIYRIHNQISGRTSHVAAQSFTADEGTIILPQWMLHNLDVRDNEELIVQLACLPYATSCTLDSHDTKTASLNEERELLEHTLKQLCCLTAGDKIQITDNLGNIFEVNVVKTAPENAVKLSMYDIQELVATSKDSDFIRTYDRETFLKKSTEKQEKQAKELSDTTSDTDSSGTQPATSSVTFDDISEIYNTDLKKKSKSKTKKYFVKSSRSSEKIKKKPTKPPTKPQTKTKGPLRHLKNCFSTKKLKTKIQAKPEEPDPDTDSDINEPLQEIKYHSPPINFEYINRTEVFKPVYSCDEFDPNRYVTFKPKKQKRMKRLKFKK